MLNLAVVGLGKMGLSHHAMINAHPRVKVQSVCDSAGYVLDVLNKYTGIKTYTDFEKMIDEENLDAVIIATPSSMHSKMVKRALLSDLHVFCEKPLCLNTADGREISAIAKEKGLVNQVGYHHRFIGAFREVKRLLDMNAIGDVTHVHAEAYGPVVLKPKGSTWRARRAEGGGCLYDYAAHPLNLLSWYLGEPTGVSGSVLNRIFSRDTEDEVTATLHFRKRVNAQLFVNWSDESHRKMSTKISIWGTNGRICADRQEIQVYLRDATGLPTEYQIGWNVRYTTELTEPVWFYMRGEEYSSQLDYFVSCIEKQQAEHNINSFADAVVTDRAIEMMIADAERGMLKEPQVPFTDLTRPKKSIFSFRRGIAR